MHRKLILFALLGSAAFGQTLPIAQLPPITAAQVGASPLKSGPFTTYTAYGDSNTAGYYDASLYNSYPARLGGADMLDTPWSNLGVNGATSLSDVSLILGSSIPAASTSLVSYMIGTNDVTAGGAIANYQASFGLHVMAQYAWLATPAAHKVLGTATVCTGTCSGGTLLGSQRVSSTGGTLTFSVTGSTVEVATTMFNGNAATAGLTCDGTATGATIRLTPVGGVSYGTAEALAVVTGLTNTTHSCVLTQSGTGTTELVWAGALSAADATFPTVIIPGIIDRYPTDTNTPNYRTQETTAVSTLRAAGYTNLSYISMSGVIPASYYVDTLHGEDYARYLMAAAVLNGINTNLGLNITVPIYRGSQITLYEAGPYAYGLGYGSLASYVPSAGQSGNIVAYGPFSFANATSAINGVAVGYMSCAGDQTGNGNVCLGDQAGPTSDGPGSTINIGLLAKTGATGAVQLGNGTNATANTMQFQGFNFLTSAGVGKLAAMLPSTLYSAAGTALPTCAVGIKGQQATVSDATSPTYMGAYTSGGAITAAVICSYNGTTYTWLTH